MTQAPSISPLPPSQPQQAPRPSFAPPHPSTPPRHPNPTHTSSHLHSASPPRTRSPVKRRPAILQAGQGSFVAHDARLEGTITLGAGCVIHPRATILVVTDATVVLGDGCVVEETAEVLFRGPGRATMGAGTVVMVGAIVELVPDEDPQSPGTGGICGSGQGRSVGEWCTFAPRSRCIGVRVGDQCTVGAGTAVNTSHTLFASSSGNDDQHEAPSQDVYMASPASGSGSGSRSPTKRGPAPRMHDRTVIYGAASAARTWDGSGEAQEREVRVNATAFLCEILPKFNKAREEGPGVTQR